MKDGKTYEGATQSGYSVKQYCYNTLSKANTTAANKRVLVDFLNYASAAQVYFNLNTKNLVNAELTDEQKAFGTATVAAIGNDRADGTIDSPERRSQRLHADLRGQDHDEVRV